MGVETKYKGQLICDECADALNLEKDSPYNWYAQSRELLRHRKGAAAWLQKCSGAIYYPITENFEVHECFVCKKEGRRFYIEVDCLLEKDG